MDKGDVVGIEYVIDMLGVRVETARKLFRDNKIPGAFRIGKSWLIHKPTFDQRIQTQIEDSRQRRQSTKPPPVPEVGSVSSEVTLPMSAKYAALLGPRVMKLRAARLRAARGE